MELENRTCLITGSSRGIGRGIAEELANEGANVAINYRASAGAAEEVVDGINTNGGSAMATQADVTDEAEVKAMGDQINDTFGPVEILVNNAGTSYRNKVEYSQGPSHSIANAGNSLPRK